MSLPTVYLSYMSPPCRTVLLVAKHLGIELNIKEVSTKTQDHKKPEYLKMNPLHTIPTLDDNGFYLPESHAIAPYLVEKYGKDDSLYPKDIQRRATVNARLHFNNSIFFTRVIPVARKILFQNSQPEQEEVDKFQEALGFLETYVSEGYVAGNFLSVADFAVVVAVSTVALTGHVDLAKYPKIGAWLKKMEALPCYSINKEALETIKQMQKK